MRASTLSVALVVFLIGSHDSPVRAMGRQSAPESRPTARDPHEVEAESLVAKGKHRDALASLDRAATGYQQRRDSLGLGRVEMLRSAAYRALGDATRSERHAQRARELAAKVHDPNLQIRSLTQLAGIAGERGKPEEARGLLEQALQLAGSTGEAKTEASVLVALGRNAYLLGRQAEGLDYLQRAVIAADRTEDVALRVAARSNTVVTMLGLSRYDDALAMAQEGYEISKQAPPPAVRAAGLFSLAQAHSTVWNLDRAAALWPEVAAAYREAGDARGEALAAKQGAETWFALADFDRAVDDGERAAALMPKAGLGMYVAESYARLALSEARRSRLAEADRWSAHARAELPTTPRARHRFVHNDAGLVSIELGQLAQARADFTRVLDVAREIGDAEYEWRAHWGFGRVAIAEGRPAEAIPPLEAAIAGVDRLRRAIPEAGLRATFMTQRVGPYETLIEALIGRSSAADDEWARLAFDVAERARSRALADLLAETRAGLTDPRLTAIRKQETAFAPRFSAVQKRVLGARDATMRAATLKELEGLEQEYEALVLRIRRENPAYAALAYPRALSAAEVAATLAPDEALVEFILTPKTGFAWVVRRDVVRSYKVPSGDDLTSQVRLVQSLLASGNDAAIRRIGGQLHQSLLAPAEEALRGARRLIIVADGVLLRLPFALLRTGDGWLIERHAITLAPSATILVYLRQARRAQASEPLLAFAVPERRADIRDAALFDPSALPSAGLPRAAAEVRAAARLVGADNDAMRIGASASEAAIKSADAGRYRILHFAAHAIVDEIVARRSAILLEASEHEDGLLQLNEIANLTLNADLVVLAACRSQMGRAVRGEGLLSLSRAFMHAGARAVISTLWPVSDRDTSSLMELFYARLRDGLTPDEALRAAQLRAIETGGPLAAPAAWATFVINGDTSAPVLSASPLGTGEIAAIVLVALGAVALVIRLKRRPAAEPVTG